MTDPKRPNDNTANPAETGEPVVSKPYIMPDDPEEGSVELLVKEATEARDKMLRTLAEMENLRKRTAKEVADARAYGITGFARDILEIADNLQRALDAIPADVKETADPGIKAFIEGVELTERSLLNTLEKNGVKKFDPSGEKFDPNFQQAMYEVPDPSVPQGTVVQVVQAGFMIGERVLRPALVGVSKGGAKAAPAADVAS
ncbi:nucleotide exchange factor GrpE [Bradyrhizobium sp. CCBAU 051011]|jgi:molecular chaperone GrpE|uniref:nucleotide exchange factor GrpE n=1 Tax=Bradyrhizobium sp. CCBAU 051011 TaxID=858422 RepID=UPI0013743938|nr:nucleotide exchange factor GrpE [Bradyrhizobium sp. CCBAU 051011]QHO73099.1 nucleotide exchange factor GrpE [Bradyrhizobium sp. CCBAU 051011]